MGVYRIQGSEVEYGIAVSGEPDANPMVASSQVVNAWAIEHGLTRRPAWNYEDETPLRDARGFDLTRESVDPSLLTDENTGMANVILTNGARLYVDHAHPEYSSPEVTSPLDVVRWEKAGELVMARAAALVDSAGEFSPLLLYKNNVDNKGASYGAHENYLVQRSVPFSTLVKFLTPFFVSRQVICGAGRLGIGSENPSSGFQLSQRADYIATEVGLETTLKRPIINTRDEPHADPAVHRRLHVIVGDANLCEVALFLKHATTSLVLSMIEADDFDETIELVDPVGALHTISHDPTLRATVSTVDGRELTALDMQDWFLSQAREHLAGRQVDEQTEMALELWGSVLARLGTDPNQLFGELDWVTKLELLERYRKRDQLSWDDPKLQLIDLQYHDVRPAKGLFHRLEAAGRTVKLVSSEEVENALTNPPEDTRAYFRGMCLARFSPQIAAASWDSIIFDLPYKKSLQRIATIDPLRGTKQHVGNLFDEHADAESLVRALTK